MTIFDSPAMWGTALAYLAVVLGIGVWALRRTRSAKDFFVAGQSIGLWVTGFATLSAAFSGFVFLGGPGLTYRIGIASLFICLPVSCTAALLAWSVGKRLRLLAEVREVYTVPDALLARFRSRAVSGAAAAAVVAGTVAYLGAQLLALGILVESLFGTRELLGPWSLPVAVGGGLVVVLLYAVGGGMLAGVYTDLVQGILMVGAAAGVFVYAMTSAGGPAAIAASITGSDAFGADFLDPLAGLPVLTALGFFFVFGIGVLGQPHMLHKFYMLDDPRKLRWIPAVVGGGQAVCVLLWLGVGVAVPALVAQGVLAPLERADDATPAFLLCCTPDLLAGLVFAGSLAAIMSTADSFVNIGSAALVRDLPRAFGRRVADELRWGRVATAVIALAAAVLACLYQDLVALLGTLAFGTFAAALAPAVAVGLAWRRVTAGAALASIAVGTGLNLGLELAGRQGRFPDLLQPGALPSAVALAASFLVLVVWSWIAGSDDGVEIDEDVLAVMEM